MKVSLYFIISILLFFMAGAWITHRPADRPILPPSGSPASNTGATAATHDKPPLSAGISAEPNHPNMWTKSATLYKDETLELHFKTPNPAYLGLIDPKEHFFYLVFPGESAVGALTPLVESKIFAGLNTLKINTGLLKADPYTHGVYTNQPVFVRSGTYTFILGENLHVDDPSLLTMVFIQYVHKPRPAAVAKDIAVN